MSSVNKCIIIGRLGQDPEVKFLEAGRAVANFSVATSEKWKDKTSGEAREEAQWHKIVVWGKQAEHCGEYLAKGRQVCVEGKITTRKWQDKDGHDRYTTEIVASNVTFLGGKGDGAKAGEDDPFA